LQKKLHRDTLHVAAHRRTAAAFYLVSGKRKFVVLQSALEDFENNSLNAVPGLLGKLHYVARLHDGHGAYSHWGLARVHGPEGAQRAMRTSHRSLLAQVLRTRLHVLMADLKSSASNARTTDFEFLSYLEKRGEGALPDRPSQKHFRSVLHALSALVQNQIPGSAPSASPLPPPLQ
jgi:hypothetical protein